VEKVNLAPFFHDRIFVAQHKNSEALEAILRAHDIHRESSWMIGNSYRTDIIPALECDIGAIYIPPMSTWAFDQIEIPSLENERFLHATSIRNMPQVLKDYLYNERVR
jgi:putative hydrolase of the HAD superfamily